MIAIQGVNEGGKCSGEDVVVRRKDEDLYRYLTAVLASFSEPSKSHETLTLFLPQLTATLPHIVKSSYPNISGQGG
jgi:hypothetical protein